MQTHASVQGLGRIAAGAVAALLSCGVPGCTNVTGGAVELSWHLEKLTGDTISNCSLKDADDGQHRQLESIKLTWTPIDTSKAPGSQAFDCTTNHGVTSFDVPPGAVLLSVAPVCPDGTDVKAGMFTAPPPIERDVGLGDVVELHAVIIQIDPDHACL